MMNTRANLYEMCDKASETDDGRHDCMHIASNKVTNNFLFMWVDVEYGY